MIKIRNLSKEFDIPTEKRQTLKEHFVNIFKKNKYNKVAALENINLEIKKGEFLGVIGRNGSGKSTLLKIIAGIFVPTKGNVRVEGKVSSFLELGVGFDEELTAKENVYLYGAILGLSRKEINRRFDSIIRFAKLEKFVNAKLKTFSSGMHVRLGFATAIQSNADIYLVDEVLAVGDADFQKKCFEVFRQFKKQGKIVVFVSHNLDVIKKLCTRAVCIDKGKTIFSGNPSRAVSHYLKNVR